MRKKNGGRRKAIILDIGEVEKIIKLFKRGLNSYEIADKSGHDRATVIYNLNKNGCRFNSDYLMSLKKDSTPPRKSIYCLEDDKFGKINTLALARIELWYDFNEKYGALFYKNKIRWTIAEVMRDLYTKRISQGKDQIVYDPAWKV